MRKKKKEQGGKRKKEKCNLKNRIELEKVTSNCRERLHGGGGESRQDLDARSGDILKAVTPTSIATP